MCNHTCSTFLLWMLKLYLTLLLLQGPSTPSPQAVIHQFETVWALLCAVTNMSTCIQRNIPDISIFLHKCITNKNFHTAFIFLTTRFKNLSHMSPQPILFSPCVPSLLDISLFILLFPLWWTFKFFKITNNAVINLQYLEMWAFLLIFSRIDTWNQVWCGHKVYRFLTLICTAKSLS